jgi:ATP-dependent phosphoenolpyruvate carboxykinase
MASPTEVGNRIKLVYARAVVDAIHRGALASARTRRDPVFGFEVTAFFDVVSLNDLVPADNLAYLLKYDSTLPSAFSLIAQCPIPKSFGLAFPEEGSCRSSDISLLHT